MTSVDQRRDRVRNGSRRKRDLEAVEPKRLYDPPTYAAEHFPDESYWAVQAAAFAVSARHGHRLFPDPLHVRQRLEEKGWLRVPGGEAA